MRNLPKCGVALRAVFCVVVALANTIAPEYAFAKPERTKIHSFWVAGSAAVTVKADQAILIMVIRGAGSDVEAALEENRRITRGAYDALVNLHLQGKFRLTENQFGTGGRAALSVAPYFARPLPRPLQASGCYEVQSYVFVTFGEDDLARIDFDQMVANTMDGLVRAGAQQPEASPQIPQFRVTGPVLFTVKDANPAVRKAVALAMAQARAMAEEVASNSGVKLGRILDARVNRPLEVTLPRREEINIADELHLQYYSASKDAVTIPATFAAQYSTK